jgi:hypothetical protein
MPQWPRIAAAHAVCREVSGGRHVVGNLTAFDPHARCSGTEQGVSGDADDCLDQRLPLGRGQGVAGGKDVNGAVFLAGSGAVPRKRGIGGGIVVGDGAGGLKQVGLVRLELDQQMVPGLAGRLERFFDSAWRPG